MVELVCKDLMICVMKILDADCSTQERNACYMTIDQFKEKHEQCMQCGFCLTAQDQNPVARHFGLQLIEHVVKHRWNSMGEDARQDYQRSLLEFLQGLREKDEVYVMEALARLTVETAKRMWPQRWTSFMEDMSSVCSIGLVQVEMVLIIFRRLAEDVHQFESGLGQLRKKEMTYALNENVQDILGFLLQNLEMPKTDDLCLQTHLRRVTLSTLASFVEWVQFPVLLGEDCKLLVLLCSLLNHEELKVSACECLLGILSRKTDVRKTAEQRERLLILLSKDALDGFWASSVKASSLLSQGEGFEEEQYVFLKRICQVLVHLGISQLGPLWLNKKEDFQVPDHFSLYLEVVLEFTKHNSQLLSMTSSEVWLSFINHNHIKDCKSFKDFLPKVLTVCRQRLLKVGDPTVSHHITSEFSRIDFDGIDEFTKFFSNYRSKVIRVISHLALLMPRTAAMEVGRVVEDLVARTTATDYSSHSMEYLEWDAFVTFLDCWTNAFKSEPSLMEVDTIKEQGICVLQRLVSFTTSASLIMQCQFRCLQTNLLCFLVFDAPLFESYMLKIFSSMGFLGGGADKYNLPKEVIATRKLIVLCFIHLCEAYPKLLAAQVDSFIAVYEGLVQRNELVNAEKATFMESLLILSVEGQSKEEQCKFIKVIFQEVQELCLEMQSAVSSVESFIQFFTLDKDPSDSGYKHGRRQSLCHIVNSISIALRRTKPSEGSPPQSHPTFDLVVPILVNFCIPLLSILYKLWSGKFRMLLSEHFRELDQFHPYERDNVLGKTIIRREAVRHSELVSLQINLTIAHESCLYSVSRAMHVYGFRHMYDMHLVGVAIKAVFPAVTSLNQYRLKTILRHLIQPMVLHCPADCWEDVLYPFLSQICYLVFTTLSESWRTIQQKQHFLPASDDTQTRDATRTESETEQVFFEQLTTLLSREYANILDYVCVRRLEGRKKGRSSVEPSEGEVEVEMDCGDTSTDDAHSSDERWSQFYSLSPLAEKLLDIAEMRELLFYSSFHGLTWRDTHTSSRCTVVAGLLYERVVMAELPAIVPELFMQVLSGLNIHGTQEQIKTPLSFLALLIYQSAISKCPQVERILAELSKVDESKIQEFNRLLQKKPLPTIKKRKEKFKELIANVIGKHVGELYKHRPTFNLPEMEFKKKPKQEPEVVELACLFQHT